MNILANTKVVNLLTAASWAASSNTLILDRANFQSAAILLALGANSGTAFDASNKITPTLKESDSTALASFTAVAAADMLTAPTVIDSNAKASLVQTIEYRGSKRYILLDLVEAGIIIIPLTVIGLLGDPTNAPVGAPIQGTATT